MVGAALAQRLSVPFLDLDDEFKAGTGDISAYITARGYAAYAERNVHVYWKLTRELGRRSVLAVSSGFMTYPRGTHSKYAQCREDIADSATTFVLLPTLELETCVVEIVRRQMTRPFCRSAAREEAVIRERFASHLALTARKVTTMRLVDDVCNDIVAALTA